MVRIAISQAAFDASVKTLPVGSVGYWNMVNERGSGWSGWSCFWRVS